MTGFSSTTATIPMPSGESLSVTFELKTLNTRFFEASIRLPGGMHVFEPEIINILKKILVRGRAFLSMQVDAQGAGLDAIAPCMMTARGYYDGLKAIQKELGVSGEINMSDLIAFPQIFEKKKNDGYARDERGAFCGH